jgi:CRISPR-associated protein Csd1
VAAVKTWFDDLETTVIEVPRKAEKSSKGKPSQPAPAPQESNTPLPLSMYALACTTARVPSEVQDGVRDSLYRAAFDPAFAPRALLPPVLQRLRIAATESGNGIRFQTSRFALIKLILKRSESPMPIEMELSATADPAYNCGRLLAVLDDLQDASQGQVGADVVARFYGNASTFPRNVFPRLLRLAKHHAGKLAKDSKKKGRGLALQHKIDEICGLFVPSSPGSAPEFPQLLNLQEQGRFALGFHQQKARDHQERQQFFAERESSKADAETEATD